MNLNLLLKKHLLLLYLGFHKNIMQQKQFLTLIIKINVSWAPNQHIRMISDGLCDTEDWSNDAENSALPSW